MEHLEHVLQSIREQQVEDFRVVMSALATSREALRAAETGLERHQGQNLRRFEILEEFLRSESGHLRGRLDQIEQRLDRLESPAA